MGLIACNFHEEGDPSYSLASMHLVQGITRQATFLAKEGVDDLDTLIRSCCNSLAYRSRYPGAEML